MGKLNLSEKAIEDFRNIYSEVFKVEITEQKADLLGQNLLKTFMHLKYKQEVCRRNKHGKKQKQI